MEFQALTVLILSFILLSVITYKYMDTVSENIRNLKVTEKAVLRLKSSQEKLRTLQKLEYCYILKNYFNKTIPECNLKDISPELKKEIQFLDTFKLKSTIENFENLNNRIITNLTLPKDIKVKIDFIDKYKSILFSDIVQNKVSNYFLRSNINETSPLKEVKNYFKNIKDFSILDDSHYISQFLLKLNENLNKVSINQSSKLYFKTLNEFSKFQDNLLNNLLTSIQKEKSKCTFHKRYLGFIFTILVLAVFISNAYIIITLIRDRRKWKELSEKDRLTSLPNRQTFIKNILKTPFYRAHILTLDIVNFRYINELYGHQIGDIVLKELSQKIKEILKDAYISRFSGNTFVAFIPDKPINIEEIKKKLENIKLDIKLKDQNLEYSPKFTIGVYYIDNTSQDNAWKRNFASTIEYIIAESKKQKKGDVYLYEQKKDVRLIIKENLEKQAFLERKLKEDAIIAYFQPIVYADSLKPYAFECLARIKDKDKILPAGMFIDVATESGLVTKIDLKMLEYIEKIRDKIPIKLFINLSPKSLYDEQIIKRVTFGFKDCIFEITEQHIVQNIDFLKELAKIYKKVFAVDDFGSGFSSLKTVIDLASENIIKYLKIDGSLVKDIAKDTYKQHAIEAIVAMAKKLDLKTIAEFVEDEETIKVLRNIGVDFLQGFYIGKPMSLEDALKFLKEKS